MTLPAYFLADLPPDAELTAQLIVEASQTLKRNRARYLADRSTAQLVALLDRVGRDWLDPGYPLRQLALAEGPNALGFSRETLATGLDDFFRQLTAENLHRLLRQDLGAAEALDHPVVLDSTGEPRRRTLAVGPEFLVHIAAGNLPNPTLTSMVLGLLTRAAQFVKCATGTALLPRLFAHSLYAADAKLGACLEVAVWPGGCARLETPLFAAADCLTATGSDATLAALRAQLSPATRFLGYGHRVSFACVAGDALTGGRARQLARAAAADVAAWDQLGCLSPQVVYVTQGSGLAADQFAELLAEELAAREQTHPRGRLPTDLAATLASRRAFYAVRAAHSGDTRVWQSPESTAWTVVYEADPQFQSSCGYRWVYVKPAPDLTAVLHGADAVRSQVSTVGLAAPEEQATAWMTTLARWGVSRVCPLGRMQQPPLTWRHDGRPALGELITWTDWED